MYQLFIAHSPMGVYYLVAKDKQGDIVYQISIAPTDYFDLKEKAVPEIPMILVPYKYTPANL